MPGIERGIVGDDGIEAGGERRARFGDALPAIGGCDIGARRLRRLVDHGTRHRDDIIVVLRPLHDGGRGAIVRRPFAARALAEDAAQAQEDEDRQRQEDDGVNIHVVFAF